MPNLAAHAALATHPGFLRRMQAALVQLASTVAADATRPAAQQQLAADILNGPVAYVDRYAWPVAGATAVQTALASVQGNPELLPDKPIEDEVLAAMQRLIAARQAAAT